MERLIRGGIYLARLDPAKGAEIGKLRPVALLSAPEILEIDSPLLFVCPLSGRSERCSRSGLRGETMSAFASIKQGLEEAAAHAGGAPSGVLEHCPHAVDVPELRRRLGLTQDQFAGRFGFSVATLRHWERGDRTPQGAALILLNVIEHNPAAVLEAMRPKPHRA